MKNPFKIDVEAGYRWYTFGGVRETRDSLGWWKIGPLSFCWGTFDDKYILQMTVLGNRVIDLM